MKLIQGLVVVLFMISCNSPKTPETLFLEVKSKFLDSGEVHYSQLTFWENPSLGEIDTFRYELIFQENPEAEFGYDFWGKNNDSEFWYYEGVQYRVDHKDSTVFILEGNHSDRIRNNSFRSFGPMNLLIQNPWTYLGDTSYQGKNYMDFLWVELDTVIMEKRVYLENHLFINPANLFPEFYSRRLFHDGKKNQVIDSFFSNYKFSVPGKSLSPEVPQGYISKVEGVEGHKQESNLLAVGAKALDFDLKDEEGNQVRLSDFRGKKVLLDFSMINCGWCKIALDQFNKPNFEFVENLVPLYINPVDSKEKMEKYMSRIEIPFPVLIDAQELGKAYGVNGYPTFFLIDENGKIEDVVVGYSDKNILKWKKGGN